MYNQILQYSCSECGMILKRMVGDQYQDLFIANTNEECPKCGYALLKTLKKERNEVQPQEQCSYSKNNRQPLPLSSPVSPSLKFQSAYDEFIGMVFDSSLIRAGLIDEFHLFINPAAIGSGMTIFKDLKEVQKFTLIKSTPFDCGIVELHFQPKRN